MYSDIYWLISFKLSLMIESTMLYNLISVWTFEVTVVWEIKNYSVHFLANLGIDFDEIQYVATTCWFVEVHPKIFLAQVIFKQENSEDVILIEYTFSIVMCWVTCSPVYFKLGMMLNIT